MAFKIKRIHAITLKYLKRNEQLFCNKCNTPFKYDWQVEYCNCPKCGNDVAK